VRYTRDLSVLGLGHVLLTVEDTQRTHDFYTGVLGFRLSDWYTSTTHSFVLLALQRTPSQYGLRSMHAGQVSQAATCNAGSEIAR